MRFLIEFSVTYDQNASIQKLRQLLVKYLLTEILKSNQVDKDIYSLKLQETQQYLGASADVGYSCFLVGCKFTGRDHRKYILHVKSCHPNSSNILCNFKKCCVRRFSAFSALVQHIREIHTKTNVSSSRLEAYPVDVGCKCDRQRFGNQKCPNICELMTYFNSFYASEDRMCIFAQCKTKFSKGVPKYALNHFRLKHKQTGFLMLKPEFRLNVSVISVPVLRLTSDIQPPGLETGIDRGIYRGVPIEITTLREELQ